MYPPGRGAAARKIVISLLPGMFRMVAVFAAAALISDRSSIHLNMPRGLGTGLIFPEVVSVSLAMLPASPGDPSI